MSEPMETRDQRRMRYAYGKVSEVERAVFKDYKSLVEGLGAQILRNGLAMAMAFLERRPGRTAEAMLLDHLAGAGLHGLTVTRGQGETLPRAIRKLDLDSYLLATREMLKILAWFKRAVQALDVQDRQGERADPGESGSRGDYVGGPREGG